MVFGMGNCTKSKLVNNQIVISVVGLDEAGKTTSVKVLKGENIQEIEPTVGFKPYEFQYNGINLILNDLGGNVRVRDIWKHYLAESYGFVFVIDSSNRNRIYECSKAFSSFLENEKVHSKPILILANKQEMANAMDESEIVQYLNVEELVNKYQIPCRIEACTANLGVGSRADEAMKAGFDWLLKFIVSRQEELKSRIDLEVSLQRGHESKIRTEKYEKFKQKRESEYNDDMDEYEQSNVDPWKALNSLNKSKTSSTSSFSDSKLSSYDKLLKEDIKESNGRLTTIDEERSKLKNRFMKSNKLVPLDGRSDDILKSRSNDNDRSWAITDSKKSPTFSRPRRFD